MTKKLTSIFLALVMMLTIIPMGTITAMAYDSNDLCECGHRYLSHVADPGFSCLSCDNGNCTSGNFTLHKCSALEKKNGQAATCTKDGWKDYYKCTLSACNKMYASTDTTGTVITDLTTFRNSTEGKIPAKGHSFTTTASSQKVTDATCIAAATYKVKCDNCTAVSDTLTVPVGTPVAHSFTTKVSTTKATDATCTAAATYYVQCDDCTAVSDTLTASVGEPNGHSYTTKASLQKATDATCTEAETYYVQCDNCTEVSDTLTVSVGEPNGHNFTNYVSNNDATCTVDGTKTAVCDNACGETDTVLDIDTAKGHKYVDGKCTVCGEKDPSYISKLTNTNDKKTSPDTGATMGLGALGLGVALLTVLKKKED